MKLSDLETMGESVAIPIYGVALCGNYGNSLIDPHTQKSIQFPQSLLSIKKTDDYFFVKAKGSSMLPYVEDGDLVLIKKYEMGREHDKKVLVEHNGTLKIKIVQRNNSSYFLFSTNADSLEILQTDEVRVIGYVSKVVKDL